jgi:hypothetical protein
MTPYSLDYVTKKAVASSTRCHIPQRKPVVDRRINRFINFPLCTRLHNLKYAFSNNMPDFWICRSEPLTWCQHKHMNQSYHKCRIYRPCSGAANFVRPKSYKPIMILRYPQVSNVTTVFMFKASESQISHTDTDILKSLWLQTWQQFHNHGVRISCFAHRYWLPWLETTSYKRVVAFITSLGSGECSRNVRSVILGKWVSNVFCVWDNRTNGTLGLQDKGMTV